MKVGDSVLVRLRPGTSFGGRRGRIVETVRTAHEEGFMVLLAGERLPMYFGPLALFPASDESSLHIGGAE